MQAISIYEAMTIETEYNNESLFERCLERNEMSKSLWATLPAVVATYRENERIYWIKQMKTSSPVSAKQNMSINNKIAEVVTGQLLMTDIYQLIVAIVMGFMLQK